MGDTKRAMSAVPKPSRGRPRTVRPILVGLLFLGIAAAATISIARKASEPGSGVQVRLGDDEFRVGDIDVFANEIARRGPLLFGGLVGTAEKRPMGLYHSGTDSARGWKAFTIVPPGSPSTCVLAVDRKTLDLVDPCTGTHYPPDGGSLPTYPTRIDDNKVLYVDLTPGGRPGQGTTVTT